MIALLWLGLAVLFSPTKTRWRLEVENVALRHQVMVLRRQARGRIRLTNVDRLFLVQLYRWFPSVLRVLAIIQPDTVIGWHRAGFRHYWLWKPRSPGGRPRIDAEVRALIRRMSIDNPLWGAPPIHGELPYMAVSRRKNLHALKNIASMHVNGKRFLRRKHKHSVMCDKSTPRESGPSIGFAFEHATVRRLDAGIFFA